MVKKTTDATVPESVRLSKRGNRNNGIHNQLWVSRRITFYCLARKGVMGNRRSC